MQRQINEMTMLITYQMQTIATMISNTDSSTTTSSNNLDLKRLGTDRKWLSQTSIPSIDEEKIIPQVDAINSRQDTKVLSRSTESIIARYCQIFSVELNKTTTDLHSHADSFVVSDNATILFYTNKTVKVSGFTKVLGDIDNTPILFAEVVYKDETTGVTYRLVINNVLYMKGMEGNLIPLFMMKLSGHWVKKIPKFMTKDPTIKTHVITIDDPELILPLFLKGITSFISTRKPTVEPSRSCIYINLTPNNSDWNPHDMVNADQK